MITNKQKQTAEAIVNIFETDSVRGDYSAVTVLEGDSGHLTYGRTQTTLGSGNLHILIERYCNTEGCRFGARLERYLPALEQRDVKLDEDKRLHNLLRASADDQRMRSAQDVFFDEVYWQLAEKRANNQTLDTGLGVTICYDSTVHGSWSYMRRRTNERLGSIAELGEKGWLGAYIKTRREWLANHRIAILRKTVYRMDTFIDMMAESLWDLSLPTVIRGREISNTTLNADPPKSFSGPAAGSRALERANPLKRGLDVREIQVALSEAEYPIKADGWFGRSTESSSRQYQSDRGQIINGKLAADSIATFLND